MASIHSIQQDGTVCGDAIESTLDNFNTLKKLWEECLETKLDPDVKLGLHHRCADTDVALQHTVRSSTEQEDPKDD